MSRSVAREVAMKIAFARLLGGEITYADTIEKSEINELPTESDVEFADSLADGVAAHIDELDEWIIKYARNWTIDRLPKVDLTILRMALYELIYSSNVSAATIINEAVVMAKKFCNDRSPAYINGILGTYVREHNVDTDAAEMEQITELAANSLIADIDEIDGVEGIEKPDSEEE